MCSSKPTRFSQRLPNEPILPFDQNIPNITKSDCDSKSTPAFPTLYLSMTLLSSMRSTANSAHRSAWLERSWSANTGVKTPVLSAAVGFALAPVSHVPSRSQEAARVLEVGEIEELPIIRINCIYIYSISKKKQLGRYHLSGKSMQITTIESGLTFTHHESEERLLMLEGFTSGPKANCRGTFYASPSTPDSPPSLSTS